MGKRLLLLGVVLVVVGLCSSAVLALDPMGPPTAGLKQEQFKVGVDYSHSKMDLELSEGTWIEYIDGVFWDAGEAESFTLKNFKTNKVYTNLGYGLAENCEGFLRVGGTGARFGDSIWQAGEEFDGSTDFAVGGGIKATFFEEGDLKLGGLFQVNWAEFNGQLKPDNWPTIDYQAADCVEIQLAEIQIAVGATYDLADNFSVYGGPFFHFVDGDLDDDYTSPEVDDLGNATGFITSSYSWAVDEDSVFGGYLGAQLELSENCSFNIEYQRTAAADALGASLTWRF